MFIYLTSREVYVASLFEQIQTGVAQLIAQAFDKWILIFFCVWFQSLIQNSLSNYSKKLAPNIRFQKLPLGSFTWYHFLKILLRRIIFQNQIGSKLMMKSFLISTGLVIIRKLREMIFHIAHSADQVLFEVYQLRTYEL